jgi:hypothetical protein
MRSRSIAAAGALLVFAGCCASTGIAYADPAPAPGPAPAPAPAPKSTIDQDGTYTVGTDIAPGTYSSAGPVGDGVCYWKRLKGSDIVDNSMSKKPQVVQIDATDTAFKTSGCQQWQVTDCLPGCAQAPLNPGDVLSQIGRLFGPH